MFFKKKNIKKNNFVSINKNLFSSSSKDDKETGYFVIDDFPENNEEKKVEVEIVKEDNKVYVGKKVINDIDLNQGRWRDRLQVANQNRREVSGIAELERRKIQSEKETERAIRIGTLARRISSWIEEEIESDLTDNAIGIEIQIDKCFEDIVYEVFSMPRFISYEIIRYKENDLRKKTGFDDCSMWLIKVKTSETQENKVYENDNEFKILEKTLLNQLELLEKDIDKLERNIKRNERNDDYENF